MTTSVSLLSVLGILVFMISVFLHVIKKYSWLVLAYSLQSFCIVLLLVQLAQERVEPTLYLAALLTLVVKVLFAPYFFMRLLRQYQLKFALAPYLNKSLTLIVLMGLTAFAFSPALSGIVLLFPAQSKLVSLGIAMMFSALVFLMNRKDVVSQIIGMLSLENGVVFVALLLGVEQPFGLELGITFDLLVWMIIATVFIGVIYKQFGSLHIAEMSKLKE